MVEQGTKTEGFIIRSLGGFYEVQSAEGKIACRACGLFRKQKITPLVGDHVCLERSGDTGYIVEIAPRKNALVRQHRELPRSDSIF